jgi:murein DD-endopeptidase MepM/ murein hydrolase activator NlpD
MENKKKKISGLFSGIVIASLCLFTSQDVTAKTDVVANYIPMAIFPEAAIQSPVTTQFSIIVPKAGKLEDLVVVERPTTNNEEETEESASCNFTDREINQVSIGDPTVFAESDTRVIDLSSLNEGQFEFPLPNGKVISPYGGRRRHSGIDIKTCPNDTIVAAFDGYVRMSRPYAGYGNIIVIRHSNGLETVYSHQSKNFVHPGDFVKAGEPIGLTGRTGRATTEHLHFEIRINGRHINPNRVIDFSTRELQQVSLVCKSNGSVKSVDVLPHEYAAHQTKVDFD